MKKLVFLPILAIFFLIPSVTKAANGSGVEVVLFDDLGEITTAFHPFGEDYRGIGSIVSGDLGDDGVEEIVVGSGPGLTPKVQIYRQDGTLINEFLAYGETYRNGLNVSICDLDGNGSQEIVTGTMLGGGPHVRIFNTEGKTLYGGGFFAYAEDFRGGVNVACGDIDGDGFGDIITGAGITGGPHIKVFTPYGKIKHETFSGSALENTGADVAVGDLNGDGDMEIIAARMGIGDPTVIVFDIRKGRLSFVVAMNAFTDYTNGIQVTSGDVDRDGADEIGVSTSKHGVGLVKFFELTGSTAAALTPFNTETEKGVIATTVSNGENDLIMAMSASPITSDMVGKYIKVDVSEQTLYAYENGVLVQSYLVSTGLWSFPTPLGKYEVFQKRLWMDYRGYYGEGNPNNYFLPGVKYNLHFKQNYFIHSAYWHSNWGHRMSHGCVNMKLSDVEWVYNWAEVGTPVEIVE